VSDISIHDDRRARRNVAVLAVVQALGGACAPIAIALGGIVGYGLLGDDKSLATLPITAFVVGTACGTLPAGALMRRFGRRAGSVSGLSAGAVGALVSALAVTIASFPVLCLGAFLMGYAAAFVQQLRFAAADTASEAFRPRAISLVLAGGIAAAIIGPQSVVYAADLVPGIPFAGAYIAASVLALGAAFALLFLDIPRPPRTAGTDAGRPILEIFRRVDVLVAVGCAASSYAVMNFVMTAAPLAMVLHHHPRDAALLGIQWHVMAMYGPSFFTGSLIGRFGAERVVFAGLLLLVGCALVALAGMSVAHFWGALILLGVGWNFGFIGGSAMLTRTYRPQEKERVQSANDFIIFGLVAMSSLLSGKVLVAGGWDAINIVVLPVVALLLVVLAIRMLSGTAARRSAESAPQPEGPQMPPT
jgi:MFS family permease